MIYVQWKAGQSRRGRLFPPLPDEDSLSSVPCVVCEYPLGNWADIRLIVVGPLPDDEEAQRRCRDREWFNAGATAVHNHCVAGRSDEYLDRLVAELKVANTGG